MEDTLQKYVKSCPYPLRLVDIKVSDVNVCFVLWKLDGPDILLRKLSRIIGLDFFDNLLGLIEF